MVVVMGESIEIMVQRAGRPLVWGTQELWPVRYPVFRLLYGPVDAHQTPPTIKCSRCLGPSEWMNHLFEEMLHRFRTQPLPGDAQTGTMGRVFTVVQSPSELEDLPNRHVGEQPHRKHHPQHHLMG